MNTDGSKGGIRARRGWRGGLAAIAATMAAMLAPGSAQAQSITAGAAPAEWVRYAEGVTGQVTAWLQEESEAAVRLRRYLNEMSVASGKPVAVELRLWVAADGTVQRITFPPFAHAQANGDLEAAIVGRKLAAPPVGMLLPLRIVAEVTPE